MHHYHVHVSLSLACWLHLHSMRWCHLLHVHNKQLCLSIECIAGFLWILRLQIDQIGKDLHMLRNMSGFKGLANGTRLIVTAFTSLRIIEAGIITGFHVGMPRDWVITYRLRHAFHIQEEAVSYQASICYDQQQVARPNSAKRRRLLEWIRLFSWSVVRSMVPCGQP